MESLRIVLNEQINDKIKNLTDENIQLKRDLLSVLNQFNIIPCECTVCKEKIYVSGENQSISGLIEIIEMFHWKDIYLFTDKDLLSFYGVCSECSR